MCSKKLFRRILPHRWQFLMRISSCLLYILNDKRISCLECSDIRFSISEVMLFANSWSFKAQKGMVFIYDGGSNNLCCLC